MWSEDGMELRERVEEFGDIIDLLDVLSGDQIQDEHVMEELEKFRPGVDFSFQNLPQTDFRGFYIEGSTFYEADLSESNLEEVNASGCNFRLVLLNSACMINATLTEADLLNADLSDANLTNADCRNAIFTGAEFEGAILTNADMRGANLMDAEITAEQLESVIIDETTILPEGM